MFLVLQTTTEIIMLLCGLLAFAIVAWRKRLHGAALILFFAPLYLLKIKIGWLPMTVLELMTWTLFLVWLAKKKIVSGSRDEAGVVKNSPPSSFARAGADKKDASWAWPILFIAIGAALSTIFSIDLKVSAGIFKAWFLAPMVFGLVLLDVVKTKEQLKAILWAAVLSALTIAVISLGYLFGGQLTFDGRLRAFYLSPNHLAMYLAPGFLLALGLWFETKKLWQKIFLVIVSWLLAIVLYFTYSYAAWLGILAAIVFLLAGLYRLLVINCKSLVIASWLLVIIFALTIFSQLNTEKLNNLLFSERSSWQSRLMVWRAAWEIGQGHWFLGIGPGLFQRYYLDYQKHFSPYLEWAVPQPHNLFLAWWLQAGLLGLVGFAWLIVGFFLRLSHFLKLNKTAPSPQTRGGLGRGVECDTNAAPQVPSSSEGGSQKNSACFQKSPLALALIAVMIYILAHGLLDTTYWKNDLALIFWTIVALSCVASLQDKTKTC